MSADRSIHATRGLRLRSGVILALMMHEIKVRFRMSIMGYFMVLAEPIFQYLTMFIAFHYLTRQPAFGLSLGVFLATGIVPYFLFMHLSSRVMGAVRSGKAFNKVQTVGFLDIALAKGLLEYLTLILFGTVVFVVLGFFGQSAVPHLPIELINSVLVIGLMGFGVGLVNGVLTKIFKFYALVYSIFARSMLFLSGVFYVPATLPAVAREYLSYNPLLHGIEWFRLGFFESYPAVDLDRGYLGGWVLGSITLGLVMLKACEAKLKL